MVILHASPILSNELSVGDAGSLRAHKFCHRVTWLKQFVNSLHQKLSSSGQYLNYVYQPVLSQYEFVNLTTTTRKREIELLTSNNAITA